MEKFDFLMLKAIFNMELYDAVQQKDAERIEEIFRNQYSYEIEEGMIKNPDDKIDTIKLFDKYNEEAKKDDFRWAL